jgi:hypothetical protein
MRVAARSHQPKLFVSHKPATLRYQTMRSAAASMGYLRQSNLAALALRMLRALGGVRKLSFRNLKQPNIELSCAAESPARSEPQQRHPFEPEDNLRRQLQRFVMHHWHDCGPSRRNAFPAIGCRCLRQDSYLLTAGSWFVTSKRFNTLDVII